MQFASYHSLAAPRKWGMLGEGCAGLRRIVVYAFWSWLLKLVQAAVVAGTRQGT